MQSNSTEQIISLIVGTKAAMRCCNGEVLFGLMPGDPKECREHAKCCLRLAAEAPSPLAKARFQKLAETWMRLATDLELTLSLLEQWGDPRFKKTGSDK